MCDLRGKSEKGFQVLWKGKQKDRVLHSLLGLPFTHFCGDELLNIVHMLY